MTATHLKITRPDDWHLHLRDGEALAAVAPMTAKQFARAIVMPNLKPPVTTVSDAIAYANRIKAATGDSDFEPLMTLYLTDNTSANEIFAAHASGLIKGVKLYPAGATTNSDDGVTDIRQCDEAIAALEQCGIPLLVHGEVTDPGIDVFDREMAFIEQVMLPLQVRFPKLSIVFEHITTADAVNFVLESSHAIAATITAHHLMYNRNAIFQGGIRPHMYCLPVLKREQHRAALCQAVSCGSNKFFLGTDSAPHTQHAKESACGCAGIFTAHAAIEMYASVFDELGALDKLEAFASFNGPDFYGMPRNQGTITLEKTSWTIPEHFPLGAAQLVPLMAGETIGWKLVTQD